MKLKRALVASAVLLCIAAPGAFAQAAPGYEKPQDKLGRPDLSGFWSNTSLTAMQRPPAPRSW